MVRIRVARRLPPGDREHDRARLTANRTHAEDLTVMLRAAVAKDLENGV